MVGLKNWLKSSRILQFLSKLVLQNNLIAHYCFFKQITEMSICHCLSVKKRVSVKNVKILEMSDFGNTACSEDIPKGKSKELIIIKEIYRANFPLSHSILHI